MKQKKKKKEKKISAVSLYCSALRQNAKLWNNGVMILAEMLGMWF